MRHPVRDRALKDETHLHLAQTVLHAGHVACARIAVADRCVRTEGGAAGLLVECIMAAWAEREESPKAFAAQRLVPKVDTRVDALVHHTTHLIDGPKVGCVALKEAAVAADGLDPREAVEPIETLRHPDEG